ncbi:DUF4384 domain-containing protein [Qingshengfaniella alkalisoli]|uniref:DUF4384 domain-containing protein n=1 Tax=Qingshengfaniella alkalisoli TaxID=2599296 RepID=A0A5B8J0D0_9RHOB|nr:DUF4384 domain-containing protein [Qingshengfaniella alkalisoli]QDY71243.1 DUF4384 domain-containing protein [Qingshengfaniella alkalisoli]
MKTRLWIIGLACSAGLHALALGGLRLSTDPAEIMPQTVSASRLDVTAYEVDQANATPQQVDSPTKEGVVPDQSRVQGTSIQRIIAAETVLRSTDAAEVISRHAAASSVKPRSKVTHNVRLDSALAQPIGQPASRTKATAPATVVANTQAIPTKRSPTATLPTQRAQETPRETSIPSAPQTVTAVSATALRPAALNQAPAALPSETLVASLAWSGDASLDPVSFAAVTSFMAPNLPQTGTDPVRDGMEGLLSSVPCARLQAVFEPDSGSILLTGHVPEEALLTPVTDSLQQLLGGAIPVRDSVRVLPPPQCGVLRAVSTVGLPQSTDQFTDSRLIGQTAQAREYFYNGGDRLSFDLTGPDYDAYLYVDYFDASGQVIHLEPNTQVPLRQLSSDQEATIGAPSANHPSLEISIGPPYGQEIALAIATSVPLHDGTRPMVEPADPYLDFLRERVAVLRTEQPDFKGEWVYFFLTTRP